MIAPFYKSLAKEYTGKAVFIKVDVNRQYELSGRYGVRSMPTFMAFVGGKKVGEFSGAGEHQLRQMAESAVARAERENVRLEFDSLLMFYGENDAMKDEKAVDGVYQKCVEGSNKGRLKKERKEECVGAAAGALVKKLKKKYKSAPKLTKRFAEGAAGSAKGEDGGGSSSSGGGASSNNNKKKPSKPSASDKPNLHLATKEELLLEMERRAEAEREKAEEDEEDEEAPSNVWSPGDFPERVTIIGAGPAGLSAAIYAARSGLTPVVVAPPLGGQLQGKGVDVENYPGLTAMTGPGVVNSMREQAIGFGAKFQSEEVLKVDATVRPIKVFTNSTTIETHTVIVATGADSKWLGVQGEWELRGGGVSSCATCDGFLFKDKHVVVVGGGDTAMEDALVLARTSKLVTVIHRRDRFRASKVLADRVLNHDNINVRWNATVKEIKGATIKVEGDAADDEQQSRKVVSSVTIIGVDTGAEESIDCAAVFIAIGHDPNTKFLDGTVDYDPAHKGYLSLKGKSTATSAPGIFAAGDSADAVYRQAITSAGSGAAAALDAERYLSESGLGNEEEELQAELMRELMDEGATGKTGGGYNAYADGGGNIGKGRKETSKVERKKEEGDDAKTSNAPPEEEDGENIEL